MDNSKQHIKNKNLLHLKIQALCEEQARTRREFLGLVGSSLLAAGLLPLTGCGGGGGSSDGAVDSGGVDIQVATTPGPNVLVILADDLGWQDTTVYGSTYYKTPNIDQLAAEGVTLYRCLCRLPGQFTDQGSTW